MEIKCAKANKGESVLNEEELSCQLSLMYIARCCGCCSVSFFSSASPASTAGAANSANLQLTALTAPVAVVARHRAAARRNSHSAARWRASFSLYCRSVPYTALKSQQVVVIVDEDVV